MTYTPRTRKSGCLIQKTQCCNVCLCVRKRKREQTESKMQQLKWNISYMLKQRSFSITGQFWTHSDITQDLAMLQERHMPITVGRALGGDNITSSWSVNRQNPPPHRPGRGSELSLHRAYFQRWRWKQEKNPKKWTTREKRSLHSSVGQC